MVHLNWNLGIMTARERKEMNRLHRLWATGRATMAQMLRCMELDRKAAVK